MNTIRAERPSVGLPSAGRPNVGRLGAARIAGEEARANPLFDPGDRL